MDFGPAPIELIERTLKLELDPGPIVLTRGAMRHVKRRHPADFERYLPFVARIVRDPTWIGDDLLNPDKIELVGRIPGGEGLLVAVVLERDERGRYRVASFYPVAQKKIDARRRSGYLKLAVGK